MKNPAAPDVGIFAVLRQAAAPPRQDSTVKKANVPFMLDEIYTAKIDDIFQGPMDLLVYLIKKNEVNIYDIPIALITDQYLEYMELMKSLNIDLVGDFIVMAATLAHIKSKMLLPAHDDEGDEDPRLEITRPLLEYLQMKAAAEELAERNILGDDTFVRVPGKEEYQPDAKDGFIKVGLFELIDAFQQILKNVSDDKRIDLTANEKSVKERISEIVDILEVNGSITFQALFLENITKSDIVVTFLAILEMVKIRLIRIAQHVQTGIIRVFYL
ncbi:MAG: segregation/condensation protein A [Desulfobacterales bacterium]|nr:segregation/condensation protein A [Desulfobacterales bacterium]